MIRRLLFSSTHVILGRSTTTLTDSIAEHVPRTLTKISQIAQRLPAELQQQVSEAGGLKHILSKNNRFRVVQIGQTWAAAQLAPSAKTTDKFLKYSKIWPRFFVPLENAIAACSDLYKHKQHPSHDAITVSIHDKTYVRVKQEPPALLPFTPLEQKLAEFNAHDYEIFRVARCLSSSAEWYPLDEPMTREMSQFLSPSRDVALLILNSKGVFEWCVRDSTTPGRKVLWLRFNRDSPFYPFTTKSRETIEREILQLKEFVSSIKILGKKLEIKKKRRQLASIVNPTTMLDVRVFAYYIYDILPPDTPVTIAELASSLPEDVRAISPSWKVLSQFNSLLRIVENDVKERMIIRGDAPALPFESAENPSHEEIIAAIFSAYPTRRHPSLGACIYRMHHRLPRRVTKPLMQTVTVLDLCEFAPNTIEVLRDDQGNPLVDTDCLVQNSHRPHRISESLSMTFRFKGSYLDDLVKAYEDFSAKKAREKYPLAQNP
jgi:hypothetical protein